MSFLNRNKTSTSQSESTEQNNQNLENVGIGFGLADVEGDIDLDLQLTDAGAVQSAFNFAERTNTNAFEGIDKAVGDAFDFAGDVAHQATGIQSRAVDTLSGAITKAGDVSRNDITDTLRRLGLPLIIGISIVLGLRALKRGK